jgi:hypothetical protein
MPSQPVRVKFDGKEYDLIVDYCEPTYGDLETPPEGLTVEGWEFDDDTAKAEQDTLDANDAFHDAVNAALEQRLEELAVGYADREAEGE